ncbi:hypothetical protein J7J83_03630 [bacterium]|nr:hypothetical protein [bacterium]
MDNQQNQQGDVTQPSSTGGVPPTTGGQSIGGAKPQSTGGVPLTTGAQQPPIGGGIHPQKPAEEDTTPANFQLGALFTDGIKIKLQPHPDTNFDNDKFLMLLASSISLSKTEKKRIIDAVPKLKQWQIDELITIFEEEKKKFSQLSKKHVPQLEKLAKQHYEDWKDLEMGQEQISKQGEEQKKADEIRKSLGL